MLVRSDGEIGSCIAAAPLRVISEGLALRVEKFVSQVFFDRLFPLGRQRGFEDLHDRVCDDGGVVVIAAAALG